MNAPSPAVDELQSPLRAPRRSRVRLQAAAQLALDTTDVAFATIDLTEIGERYVAARDDLPAELQDPAGAFGRAVVAAREVVVVDDVRTDPRFADLDLVVAQPHVRSYVGAPIRGRDGRIVGVFNEFWTRPIALTPDHRTTIELLAVWAGKEFTAATAENAAERVQHALRPRSVTPVAGYELAGRCVPALQIGGDFYDWHPVPDGLAVTLGDVMGKGVGAGMLAASVRASLRVSASATGPGDAVGLAEHVLAGDFEAAGSFATLFHAHLRPRDGRVRFVDAGHGLTVVVRRDGESVRLHANTLPLGLIAGEAWRAEQIVLEPGDTLVAVSDGVVDLFDGTLDSLDRVVEAARTSATAQEIVDRISDAAQSVEAPDDVTVVALRRVRA